nr:HlyD family efflux transporter periplasmic adaptor subunit [Bradyrhizobium sp. 62]
MAFAKGEFRITAKAVVEGAIQRSIVAPFDGYVASAPVRAGDIVEPDQMMATLDDRELKLEAARWKSERDQQTLKYSDAMSKHDRSVALVVSASLEQTAAQLSLVEDKLARAAITAPFRGVVVSGDLRQLIGSPVEKGKVLFEIAPLESFRVILQVDERDIAFLSEGQQGTLVLTGLSSDAVPFNVKVITPVATASEGHNQFRVEAAVQGVAPLLRPGMEGIGKISIDRRSLLAIWTRSLIDWIHITAWKWLP